MNFKNNIWFSINNLMINVFQNIKYIKEIAHFEENRQTEVSVSFVKKTQVLIDN
jgi:hypothetical protein